MMTRLAVFQAGQGLLFSKSGVYKKDTVDSGLFLFFNFICSEVA